MTPIEFLAWFTVVGIPALLIIGATLLFLRWLRKTTPVLSEPYAYTVPPPTWKETTTTFTTTQDAPEVTYIDPAETWDDEAPASDIPNSDAEVDSRKIVEAGTRVWRVYCSVNQQTWVECDPPVMTERAACNYATYIKRNNPKEYVRVNDPEGLIVSYE